MLPRIVYVVTTSCGCLIIDLIVFYILFIKPSMYVFNKKSKHNGHSSQFRPIRVKLTIYPTPNSTRSKCLILALYRQERGALIGFEYLPFP